MIFSDYQIVKFICWRREHIDKFAHLASFEELEENDFNLNIPRYVDTFEEKQVAPLSQIVTDINRSNQEIEQKTADLLKMLGQLRGTSPEAQEELDKFLEGFRK